MESDREGTIRHMAMVKEQTFNHLKNLAKVRIGRDAEAKREGPPGEW